MDIKCRVCLSSTEEKLYHSLSSSFPVYLRSDCPVVDLLENITSTKVLMSPGWPHQLCTACLRSLKECVIFIEQFHKSQVILKQRLEEVANSVLSKTEDEMIILKVDPAEENTVDPLQINGNISARKPDMKLALKPTLKQKPIRKITVTKSTNKKVNPVNKGSTRESKIFKVVLPLEDFKKMKNDADSSDHTYTRHPGYQIKDYEIDSEESISGDDTTNNSNDVYETIKIISTVNGSPRSLKRPDRVMSVNDVLNVERKLVKQQPVAAKPRSEKVNETIQPNIDPLGVVAAEEGIQDETTKLTQVFRCSDCPKVFGTSNELRTHINTHSPEYMEKIKCKECGHQSRTKSAFIYHKRKHLGIINKCDECDKECLSKWQLMEHKSRKHGEGLPDKFMCNECGRRFKYSNALKYHIISVHHKNEKGYLCGFCGYKCVTQSYLKRHERCHTDERPYKCKFCPKTFRGTAELYLHHSIHEQKTRHHCKHCGKGFMTGWNMRVHWLQHDGNYECELCTKSFIDEDALKFHYVFRHKVRDIKQSDNESMLELDEGVVDSDTD